MTTHGSFEIFRKVSDGYPTWMETCASLDSAIERAGQIASKQSGDYFIFDRENKTFVDAGQLQPIPSQTRVLVADDHEEMRKGICRLLQRTAFAEVVGEAANGKEAIESARNLQPDLIIMDLSMPVLDGLSAAQVIKKSSPQTAILMFSMHANSMLSDFAKSVGLDGFVAKDDVGPTLLRAIDAIRHNQSYFPA
jgi:CheY-like chemotaxis protein